jgi:hypothetical protein
VTTPLPNRRTPLPCRLTPADAADYREGRATLRALGERHGVSAHVISRWLQEMGVAPRGRSHHLKRGR